MTYEASIGLYCFLGMLALIFAGVPVFMAMLVAALVGSSLIGGMSWTLYQFATASYWITAVFTWAVIHMFILMGMLAADAGIGESAYNAAIKWVGGMRGGLLVATIGASALFGACTGTGMAPAAIFTRLALPELDRQKYHRPWSLGCIAAASGLAGLIPPSVGIIVLCILTGLSIGKELVAGIIPGILLAVMFAACIAVLGRLNPERLPKVEVRVSWKERWSSLMLIWPIVFLFLLVIGGIYAAVFPPTIGGAIGSFGVLIYAFAVRTKLRTILHSFWETNLVGGQLFPLIIGGFLFSRFIALSGLPTALIDVIAASGLPPLGVMALIVLFYLFVGCVMEFFSILIITIPIVFPLLVGLGFEPIGTGIVLILLGAIAGLTPPVGIMIFVVAVLAKVDPTEVFRGILPFFFVLLILVWLIIFFPAIANWLPLVFYK